MKTLYWYDFETFGADPRRDRAAQFAGIRTDESLNIIGDPLVCYCKPANDFLPDPGACLITGITPQLAAEEGVCEAEFTARIHAQFSQANTTVVGYNSIRFDDEVTRQLLYRNFFDPYEREWKNGNSRWDIIDMVRLCAATRPEGINWPKKDDGSNSFRLDQLTVANDIEHGSAHDALADVKATIALAALIRKQQPRLYEFVYQLRDKRRVKTEIDLVSRSPFVHVSVMYPASQGCLALVMPVCQHPTNSNAIIAYDLRTDPDTWSGLDMEEIRQRVFSASADLPEGVNRVPLKNIHINRCPVVASPAVLNPDAAERFGIDLEMCRQHWQKLQDNPDLTKRVREVYKHEPDYQEQDPDYMIYSGGFFSESDRALMQTVRETSPEDLDRLDLPFKDSRLSEMLFRYRARNFPDTLNNEDADRWEMFRRQRLQQQLPRFEQQLSDAIAEVNSEKNSSVLSALGTYRDSIF